MIYSKYAKILKVILSCKTFKQLKVANKYVTLAYKDGDSIVNSLLYTQLVIKSKQLEDDVASGCCLSLEN